MPRGVRIDLAAPEPLDTVDVLPSPPPAYSVLPEADDADQVADADEDDDAEAEFSDEDDEDEDEFDSELEGLLNDGQVAVEESEELDERLVPDHQDWDNVSGDLTKRYNRLRQHVGAISGSQTQRTATGSAQSPSVPLPAQNQHRRYRTVAASSGATSASAGTSNGLPTGVHTSKLESSLFALSHRYNSALNLGMVGSTQASTSAVPYSLEPSFTSNAATRKGGSERHNMVKDKSDRATNEQVLDPRTRLILFKMLGRGLLEIVEGCVSTGKEANVYHALGRVHPDAEPPSPQVHLALKIYKTSILTFKTRSKYLTGEFRFKTGYSKVKNPRKMVRLWAEKEMRNLKRLHSAGLRCPEPVEVRNNVLVMTFLGLREDGWDACPRLKDAELPAEKMETLYLELLWIVRRMYKVCRLVHADLSEYNILYHPDEQHLYTIDVSQSVEHDHPHAFDFLRSDIANIDEFFGRRGVHTLGIKRTFGLIIEPWGKDGEESEDDVKVEMDRRLAIVEEECIEGSAGDSEQQDKVFKQSYIPRTLNEVFDPERDVQRIAQGEQDQLIYAEVARVVAQGGQGTASTEAVDDSTSSTSDAEEESDEDVEARDDTKQPRGHRHEDRDAKRERKQAVKEEQREKRKDKIPKGVKKAKVKRTSGKNRK